MGTWRRRTSCGQPQATVIFPAHSRAASSSATSTTVKPPRCSLVSMNGPSVNSGVPLGASTLNTGTASSTPPVKMKTPAAFISATSARTALDFPRNSSTVWSGTHSSLKAMRYSVMSPPLPEWPPAATFHPLHERRRPDPTPRQPFTPTDAHAAGGVLGDTGNVAENAALPDGWLALGGCRFEPGGDLVTGRSPESLAGVMTALLGQNATS